MMMSLCRQVPRAIHIMQLMQIVFTFLLLGFCYHAYCEIILLDSDKSKGRFSDDTFYKNYLAEKEREQSDKYQKLKSALAVKHWPEKMISQKGEIVAELVGISPYGDPIYVGPCNVESAITTAVNQVRNTPPFNVNGTGWLIGLWDGGHPRATHVEFGGRVTIGVDNNSGGGVGDTSTQRHPTHVCGTLSAFGIDSRALGMAPRVPVRFYNWTNDTLEMQSIAATTQGQINRCLVSNHSYGTLSGWRTLQPQEPPIVITGTTNTIINVFYGDPTQTESHFFGRYDDTARNYDGVVFNAPFYLPFKSAGNDRADSAPLSGVNFAYSGTLVNNGGVVSVAPADVIPYNPAIHQAGDGVVNGGYDTIPTNGCAKNVMTVGAVGEAVMGGGRNLTNATMAPFSGWGPCDDGRIKPDIVACGINVYSTVSTSDTAYEDGWPGTSMASPNACGGAVLLEQVFANLNSNIWCLASSLKAIIIHTADDLGLSGPDYQFGWGLMNTRLAADLVRTAASGGGTNQRIIESTLSNTSPTWTTTLWSNGIDPIKATLCWTDPPGPAQVALDSPTLVLVNDLDLRVAQTGTAASLPFSLNPAAPAATPVPADNTRDNVEQVLIPTPVGAGPVTVTVTHKGVLTNGAGVPTQVFSLIITGLTACLPDLTIEESDPIDLCDDDASTVVEIHGFASGCAEAQVNRIDYQVTDRGGDVIRAFGQVGVEHAPLPAGFLNYVININSSVGFPAGRFWRDGDVITVRATMVGGLTKTADRTIRIRDINPDVTIESPNPLDVCETDKDVEIHGFAVSCDSDPINRVMFTSNDPITVIPGLGPLPSDWWDATIASRNADGVNWVARLGAPGVFGGPIPNNGTKITVVAQTAANRNTIIDSTSTDQPPSVVVNWPHLSFAPPPAPSPMLILSGPIGSGLGVQPALRGTLWVQNTGLADTGQINANLALDLAAAGGFVIPQENVKITPKEFNLAPGQPQQIKFEVSIPVNTSFGAPLIVPGPIPPLPSLPYQSAIMVQGSCVNPLAGAGTLLPILEVTVTPYRDDDLIRRGFTGFCEDCADAWQAFSFPVVGVDNPVLPTFLGSTLRNQLEDDFGPVNEGVAPFQAVRWDPARRTNLSFMRYNPARPLLEPNPQANGFPPNILPGEAFSMVRRTRGDITMDGYFVDHAPNLPEANYPLARFPNLNGDDYRGSWDLTFPPPITPLPLPPATFTDSTQLLVGNPFAFPIRIYQQGVFGGNAVISQINALPPNGDLIRDVRHYNRWVGQLFLQIQNGLGLPATFSPWNGTLQPTQGCWVTFGTEANLACGIRFNAPPVVSDQTPWPQMIDFTFSKKKDKGGVELPDDLREIEDKAIVSGWGYRITAINGEGLSRTLVVGAYPGASLEYDNADVESLFSIDTRPDDMDFDFVIDHPGWGATGLFLREMVDPDAVGSGVTIPLQVLSSLKDDITLVCEAIGTPPRRLAATISEAGGSPLVDLTSPTGSLSVPSGSSDYVLTLKTWATSDVNQDDSVDSLDLFSFSKEYEKLEPKNPADLNNNDEVEAKDLIELLKGMK